MLVEYTPSIGADIRQQASARRPRTSSILWLAAGVVMLGAATWQRLTGPTHPRRGRIEIAGQEVRYRLLRSQDTGAPLRVAVAVPEIVGTPVTGTVHFRRYPTDEPFRAVTMSRQDATLAALLPTQPPAGKIEYFVVLDAPGKSVRIPEGGEPLLARFKGHVPLGILLPHVIVMFFAMLIGVRAALAAALGRLETRRLAWLALVGITLGGMMLGPIVQKLAFGTYWTGWPLGGDLTDNKTAAMWLAWIAAAVVLQRRRSAADHSARAGVVVAALVMLAVYVIPHSLRGSEFDYSGVDSGESVRESAPSGR